MILKCTLPCSRSKIDDFLRHLQHFLEISKTLLKCSRNFEENSPEYIALEKRLNEATLWDFFIKCLGLNGYDIPDSACNRNFRESTAENKELHPVLINIYQSDRQLALVCEMLMDLDEGLQEWRYRHVKMVERTIGGKLGTGGTVVTEYLKKTLFNPVFPDLWAIRTEFEYVPNK